MKTRHQERSTPPDPTPSSLREVLAGFEGCFTKPSFETFTSLVTGWLACPGRHRITNALLALGPHRSKHHSSYYRFFSEAPWSPAAVGEQLFKQMLDLFPDSIEVMVDDTLVRRSGPRIFGISMHHDGVASGYSSGGGSGHKAFACGHSWVVLSVRLPLPWCERGYAIPVLARLYQSPKRCSKEEYRKRTELAREMLEMLRGWLPTGKDAYLSGDREYTCRTLLRDLDERIQFTGPMPMDAALYEPTPEYSGRGRPRKHGDRIASPAQRAADPGQKWQEIEVDLYGSRPTSLLVQTWTCLWYTATGQRLVRVVLTRDPKGNFEDRAYLSTDVDAEAHQILSRYASRWLIEVSFRDCKQIIGLGDPQNGFSRGARPDKKRSGPQPRGERGRHAVERTAPFAWMVYGILVLWYVRQGRSSADVQHQRDRATWYTTKEKPSVRDMLRAIRTEILAQRLSGQPLLNRTLEEARTTVTALNLAA